MRQSLVLFLVVWLKLVKYFLKVRCTLRPMLFPYTTLFRSHPGPRRAAGVQQLGGAGGRQRRQQHERGERLDVHPPRSEEHTSELQSPVHIVCRLLLENKNKLDEAVPSIFSGAMAKAGKGRL